MIEAQAVIEDALSVASRMGADGCIVLVDEDSHADVRFALNTTEITSFSTITRFPFSCSDQNSGKVPILQEISR